MKKIVFSIALIGLSLGTVQSCKSDEGSKSEMQMVKENYADIVLAGYEDSHALAVNLKTKVDAFVANPTEAGFTEAKEAWYASREPYGQTEAFRFANGPIDSGEHQVEGLLNAWPLDESFVDYVNYNDETPEGNGVNIINNISQYPSITKEVLRELNEFGGNERSVSLGYHGIEFLLWGQDTQVPTNGPEHTTGGNRMYKDYTTAEFADRRGEYLKVATEALVEDLAYLVDEWKEGSNNYRKTFLAMEDKTAISNMIAGVGILAGSELAEERILVAVAGASQEDEHSCFSDNTHRDVALNYDGIKNVYKGTYTRIDGSIVSGKSLYSLLKTKDATKADEILAHMDAVDASLASTTIPFDYSIMQPQQIPVWNNVVNELREIGEDMGEAAGILEVEAFSAE